MLSRLYLRPVELKDAEQLFQWRNEKSVRENSFSMDPLQYEEHMRWFKNTLNDTEQFFFILIMNDIAIGQIRVKREGNLGIINYSIATQYRAQGYGKKMLILIENYFVQADIQLVLTAYVKAKNIASQRIFEDLGYVLLEHSDGFCYEKRKLSFVPMEEIRMSQGGVLFLTNNRNALRLCQWLEKCIPVSLYSGKVSEILLKKLQPDMIISYNYNFIISEEVIQYMKGRILNLHVSYLPWNRGSSPNFWSFIDNTPKGVTIHYIDKGLDTGDILFQQEIVFDETKETFASSYERLNTAITNLFKENWEAIRGGKVRPIAQVGDGSYHTLKDFQHFMNGRTMDWTMNIHEFKKLFGR